MYLITGKENDLALLCLPRILGVLIRNKRKQRSVDATRSKESNNRKKRTRTQPAANSNNLEEPSDERTFGRTLEDMQICYIANFQVTLLKASDNSTLCIQGGKWAIFRPPVNWQFEPEKNELEMSTAYTRGRE